MDMMKAVKMIKRSEVPSNDDGIRIDQQVEDTLEKLRIKVKHPITGIITKNIIKFPYVWLIMGNYPLNVRKKAAWDFLYEFEFFGLIKIVPGHGIVMLN